MYFQKLRLDVLKKCKNSEIRRMHKSIPKLRRETSNSKIYHGHNQNFIIAKCDRSIEIHKIKINSMQIPMNYKSLNFESPQNFEKY